MNLGDIVSEVNAELQYAPNSTTHKTSVKRIINAVYLDICAACRWGFLERTHQYSTRVDTKHWMVFTSPFRLLMEDPLVDASISDDARLSWAGALVKKPSGATTRITGRDGEEVDIWGVSDLVREADAGGGQFGYILYREDMLPVDCSEILDVRIAEGSGFTVLEGVTNARDTIRTLDLDRKGTPEAFFIASRQSVDAPARSITVTVEADAADQMQAGDYKWFTTHVRGGVESPPSNIVSATLDGAQKATITLNHALAAASGSRYAGTALDTGTDADFTLAASFSGIQTWLYRSDNGGPFYAVDKIRSGAASHNTFTQDSLRPDTVLLPVPEYRWHETSGRTFIQLYPRPEAATLAEVRYLASPYRLTADVDTPLLPPEFHRLLVHRAVEVLAAQHDGMALSKVHRKLGEDMMKRMRRRYLGGQAATHKQREYFDARSSRVIQNTITWNG